MNRLKNGEEVRGGEDGTLNLNFLTPENTGIYKCFTETEAGPSLSEEALITVNGKT